MTPDELRQRRRDLSMSQAKLAAALGITENRYQAWEAGRNAIPPYLHLALDALAFPRAAADELTTTEAAAMLEIGADALLKHIRAGALPARAARNDGRGHATRYLIALQDLVRYARTHAQGTGGKLTEDEAREILAAKAGHTRRTARALATRYHVSTVAIRNIWSGAAWSHLQPPKTEEK
jgi:transcriptional regulator with XRE-family HTH domain